LDASRNKGWVIGRYFTLYKPNDMTFPWHSWLGVSESILLFMKGKPKFNSARPDDTSFWHDTYNWSHKNLVLNETVSDRQKLEHPSIKPIPVCQDLIWKTSFYNEIIYDPFGGSGSTLIACEKLNRKCRMMEISETYCQVILDRWEKFTSQKAVKL
jgi:DNA modification methylase